MIMDAGLLTVTSVRENNNQRTGSESAVLTPLWNIDMLVSMLGKNILIAALPSVQVQHGPQLSSDSTKDDEVLWPSLVKTLRSLLVELVN